MVEERETARRGESCLRAFKTDFRIWPRLARVEGPIGTRISRNRDVRPRHINFISFNTLGCLCHVFCTISKSLAAEAAGLCQQFPPAIK